MLRPGVVDWRVCIGAGNVFLFYVKMWKTVENANDCEVLVFRNVENVTKLDKEAGRFRQN